MNDELKEIKRIKSNCISRIKNLTKGYLYESGFVVGKIGEPSRPLKLYPFSKILKVDNCEFEAVSEFGFFTDSFGGGALEQTFSDLPVETLLKLEKKLPTVLK